MFLVKNNFKDVEYFITRYIFSFYIKSFYQYTVNCKFYNDTLVCNVKKYSDICILYVQAVKLKQSLASVDI